MSHVSKKDVAQLFRTPVDVEASSCLIMPDSKLFFIGSCFTQNIGSRCSNYQLSTTINPFGIVYNPVSIASQIERLISRKPYIDDEVFLQNGLYHTFDHHSCFSHQDRSVFLARINEELLENSKALINCDFLFITLGTAYAYTLIESNKLVANCHKYPAKSFFQKLLTVEEVVADFSSLFSNLKQINPRAKVVLSVSPIRHLRDGFHANNLSKATLLLAISHIQTAFKDIHYFPAYEIVLDELRDYRFFAADMVHLSELAINYVWDRFSDSFFHDDTIHLVAECNKLISDLAHRPFNPDSHEYHKFLLGVQKRITLFDRKYHLPNQSVLSIEVAKRLDGLSQKRSTIE